MIVASIGIHPNVHSEFRRYGDQLSQRFCLHLAHLLTAMRFHRDLADAKLAADLLVQEA